MLSKLPNDTTHKGHSALIAVLLTIELFNAMLIVIMQSVIVLQVVYQEEHYVGFLRRDIPLSVIMQRFIMVYSLC
jgi:hypothetical protein